MQNNPVKPPLLWFRFLRNTQAIKLVAVLLIGLLLGFFMVLLLPAILGTFICNLWTQLTGTPIASHSPTDATGCDGGATADGWRDAWIDAAIGKALNR